MALTTILNEKYLKQLNNIILVMSALSLAGGAYYFYKKNIWHPKVTVKGVDWNNGIASITIGGEDFLLFDGSTLYAGGIWGVRFNKKNKSSQNDRIEVIRNNMTHFTIAVSPELEQKEESVQI